MLTTMALVVLALTPGEAADGKKHLVFNVLRDGSPIGKTTLDIDRTGPSARVKMVTDINVKILGITAYEYKYAGAETWAGEKLTAFKSQTDDNGKPHAIMLTSQDDKATMLDVDGAPVAGPQNLTPASFWNPKLMSRPVVFDTADGAQKKVAMRDMGMDTITMHGAAGPAHHYRLTGALERDVWFAADDTPARFQLKGRDGSLIVSELQ